jgi:PAS domain S-box-containing protein
MRVETLPAWTAAEPAAQATAIARVLGAYALAGGLVSLVGWAADVPRLTDWFDHGISIQPNTAVAVAGSGAAVLLLHWGRRRAGAVFALAVAAIGASSLFQYAVGVNFETWNTLLMFGREWGRMGVTEPGRIGPPGSVCWTLLGAALALAASGSGPGRRAIPALGLVALGIAALSIIGYVYGAGPLYSRPYLTAIAFQTATFVAAIAVAAIASAPEHPPARWLLEPGTARTVGRALVPVVVAVPPLLGWLQVQGELAGYYDSRFGVATLVLALVGLLLALLFWSLGTISRHEARQRESERRVVDTLESITDACVTFDRSWRYVLVNERASKMLGKDRAELLGRSVWDLFPEHVGSIAERELKRAASSLLAVEFEIFEPQRERWLANRAFPTPDGGVALYFRDVTERKQAAQRKEADLAALTRLQALSTKLVQAGDLETLLQEILAAACELTGTPKGTIRLRNPRGETLHMFVHQGLSARFLAHFANYAGDFIQRERVIVADVTRARIAPENLEMILEEGIRAIQATPLVSREGVLLGVLANHFPAPHRPGERELRYVDVLARMAADLIERSQAEHALREADRRKDEFLAMLAHELRNPLAPMRNAVEILRLADGDGEVVQRAVELMDRQVRQMVRLVEDLLDVSRITRGRIELRRERIELGAAVEQAVEEIRPQVERRNQKLEVALPREPIHLLADTARLTQVIGNLLSNACKFTDRGGCIQLAVERDGGRAVVRVRDNGVGIAADQLQRIFDMFVQVDTSLERSVDGLGIGLTLVKSLVELHGGTVEVQSEGLGWGAEFVLRLPVD